MVRSCPARRHLQREAGRHRQNNGPIPNRATCVVGDKVHGRSEQRWIAAKLVDQKPGHQSRIGGIENSRCTDDLRDDPASVDVADQETGTSADRAKPMLAMSLARRSTSARFRRPPPIDVRFGPQALEAVEYAGQQARLHRLEVSGGGVAGYFPLDDELRTDITLWFEHTGFMWTEAATRQARAWSACARPISPPSAVTAALLDMFSA